MADRCHNKRFSLPHPSILRARFRRRVSPCQKPMLLSAMFVPSHSLVVRLVASTKHRVGDRSE